MPCLACRNALLLAIAMEKPPLPMNTVLDGPERDPLLDDEAVAVLKGGRGAESRLLEAAAGPRIPRPRDERYRDCRRHARARAGRNPQDRPTRRQGRSRAACYRCSRHWPRITHRQPRPATAESEGETAPGAKAVPPVIARLPGCHAIRTGSPTHSAAPGNAQRRIPCAGGGCNNPQPAVRRPSTPAPSSRPLIGHHAALRTGSAPARQPNPATVTFLNGRNSDISKWWTHNSVPGAHKKHKI